MNHWEMEAFLKVTECGNFSEAARRLYIPQSTLSTRIHGLEAELGVRLFARQKGKKNAVLTEAGKQLAFAGKNWILFMEALRGIKEGDADRPRVLRFGAVDTYNAFLLGPLFQALRRRGGDMSLRIRTYNSMELYQEVDAGRLDAAFTLLSVPMDGIGITPLFEEPRAVLFHREDEPAAGRPLWEGLDRSREIFFIGDRRFNEWHDAVFPDRGAQAVQVDTDRLLRQMMEPPGSWSVVPYLTAREIARDPRFAMRLLDDSVPKRVCYRIQRKNPDGRSRAALLLFDEVFQPMREDLARVLCPRSEEG